MEGSDKGFKRGESLIVEGQLILEYAIIEEEDDRIEINGYDLHDLISSQFSIDSPNRRQRLGKFRVTVERIA